MRVIAIDWSGAKDEASQRRHIWIADTGDCSVGLWSGETREHVCAWLIAETKRSTVPMIVGFDFAFSFPSSFLRMRELSSVEELWHDATQNGEAWLSSCEAPFWGRPRKKCPPTHTSDGFRLTDRAIEVNGIRPKSPFQIGGAGAVGTGSIRGMPVLLRLREAGFSIWPFHEPGPLVALEIYPRLLTGGVRKKNAQARIEYLRNCAFDSIPAEVRKNAEQSEDAFDALVSAVRMRRRVTDFAKLRRTTDEIERLEGRIWQPAMP